ncbi:MAG: alpha/beta fold hydrolase [Candidatus Thermoplasmatota archaeon]|nr:alpha/beta fold hydrolase [Candidatus Thermoplasmatota archaeon]
MGEPEGRRLEENPRYLWTLFRSAVDYIALNTETGRDMVHRAKPYPDPFVFSHLEAHAGAELGAWVGMLDEPAPLILFVPGTFATKDASNTRAKVLRLQDEVGAHAVALDQRGFGHSSTTRSTGGYLEAFDLAHIADHFSQDQRVEEIILVGESLGAAASLLAPVRSRGSITGVLAINPFADLEWVIRFIATHPPRSHAFHVAYHAFKTLLRHITGRQDEEFDAYMAKTATSLGMTMAELSYHASPRFHLGELQVPTLILHAVDDPIIPAFHAHILREVARENPLVNTHLTRTGGHTYFDLVDEAWYWDTVLGFLREVIS